MELTPRTVGLRNNLYIILSSTNHGIIRHRIAAAMLRRIAGLHFSGPRRWHSLVQQSLSAFGFGAGFTLVGLTNGNLLLSELRIGGGPRKS
jgi:hypothetical protein